MITVGIDSVEIDRFTPFLSYSRKKLSRIFSNDEIDYCLKEPKKSAERLAVRFAAKEAFLKALTPRLETRISLLTVCRSCSVITTAQGIPHLRINSRSLGLQERSQWSVSLTHTSVIATAVVILADSSLP